METPTNLREGEETRLKTDTGKKKYNVLHVYFEENEAMTELKRAAKHEGLQVSSWARMVLMKEAKRVLGE
jgi:hypothetical protein